MLFRTKSRPEKRAGHDCQDDERSQDKPAAALLFSGFLLFFSGLLRSILPFSRGRSGILAGSGLRSGMFGRGFDIVCNIGFEFYTVFAADRALPFLLYTGVSDLPFVPAGEADRVLLRILHEEK